MQKVINKVKNLNALFVFFFSDQYITYFITVEILLRRLVIGSYDTQDNNTGDSSSITYTRNIYILHIIWNEINRMFIRPFPCRNLVPNLG